MKKLLALLTIAAVPVLGFAGVAHADEDNGGPPVNPTITNITTNGSGPCAPYTRPPFVSGNECGGVAPVNPTITTVVVTHQPLCSSGDPECNAPPATVAPEDNTPVAVVDAELPVVHHAATNHVTTAHTHSVAQSGEATLSLMAALMVWH